MNHNKKWLWVLLALTVFLFIFKLGSFTFFDGDEPKYAQVVKEMVQGGDWATLHYNQEVWFDKPPLYFWFSALAAKIRGINEFSIRLLAALAGLLTVFTTYKLGKELFSEKVGILSGFILAAALQFTIQSRICVLDTTLVLFLTLSILLFYQFYKKQKNYYLWGFYAVLALAVLTKGLIGIFIPATTLFLFVLFRKEWNLILKLLNPIGILLFFLIASPWYIIEWQIHGQAFLNLVFGFLFLSRFSGAVDNQPGPWFYYFISITLGFFPFAFLLPFSLVKAFKNRRQKEYLLILCFILPVFIVFSAASTKLPNYALPLFPFFAVLIANFWYDFTLSQEKQNYKTGFILSNLFFFLTVTLLAIGFILLGQQFPNALTALLPQVRLLSYTIVGFGLLYLILFLQKKYRAAFISLVFLSIGIVLVLITGALPQLENFKTSKPLGAEIQKLTTPEESLGAYRLSIRPGVVYYPNRHVIWLDNEEQLLQFLKQPKKAYFLIAPHEFKPLENKLKPFTKLIKGEWDLLLLSNDK